MTMERIAAFGITGGWIGTLGTLASSVEGWLKVLVVSLAVAASGMGLVAAYWTIRARKAEANRRETESAFELARLCERCRDGHPPPICPLPVIDRPNDCPHHEI